MPKKNSISVVIGRFSIFHNGHAVLINKSFEVSEKTIIILGSSFRPRTIKNPFTGNERALMISNTYNNDPNLLFGFVNDYMYNDQQWVMAVQSEVDRVLEESNINPDDVEITLVGEKKDDSSFYLDLFPQWKYVGTGVVNYKGGTYNSTELRKILFESDTDKTIEKLSKFVPKAVLIYLREFMNSEHFITMVREHHFIKNYKKAWEKAPYAPTFVTVDSVVICSGHILLIRRRAEPGRGLWAVPGGFLDQSERVEDACIRELYEETKIKVPKAIIKGSIKAREVFDHPDRSLRGRTITHAYLIVLPAGELPRVKGSDDADKAQWIPLSEIKSENMFDDHYDVIMTLIGRI